MGLHAEWAYALGAAPSALLLKLIAFLRRSTICDDLRRSCPTPPVKVGRVLRSSQELPPPRSRRLPASVGINDDKKRRRWRRQLRRHDPIGPGYVRATNRWPNRQFAFLRSAAEQRNVNRRSGHRFVARITARPIGSWRRSRRRGRRPSSSPSSNFLSEAGGWRAVPAILGMSLRIGISRKIIFRLHHPRNRIMAAETTPLRPILADGTAMSAHRPIVHTMGDGPARWFGRNRPAGRAASASGGGRPVIGLYFSFTQNTYLPYVKLH